MTTAVAKDALVELASQIPDEAKDIKLNLKSVLNTEALSPEQAWGTALACACNENPTPLVTALLEAGAEFLSPAVIEDAKSVAALMSMNNVYYRFRHMIGKDSYSKMPARLRMTKMAKPSSGRENFELFSLAVSAINGCEMCITSHEKVLVDAGITEAGIHEAVRIAAVIRASAVALRL